MDLDNPFKVVMYYFLIGGLIGLSYQDRVPMVSALVYTITH